MTLGLITSAAYINQEMSAEFGMLPPAFLPVGNTRLFRYQAELLKRLTDRVVLTLPESYCVAAADKKLLAADGVETIYVPDGLSLGELVMLGITLAAAGDEPTIVLHGDTLFLHLDAFPQDRISVHSKEHPYPWATIGGADGLVSAPSPSGPQKPTGAVVSGAFSFSQTHTLLKCLSHRKHDFLAALNAYARLVPGFKPLPECGEWLDFGHLNTYYDSRRLLTTEREFNTLSIRDNVVTKTSKQRLKMEAEAYWFEHLPVELRPFVPTYLGREIDGQGSTQGYSLSYEYLCPLSDLYVFGALPAQSWRHIFEACAQFLALSKRHVPSIPQPAGLDELYVGKTIRRFSEFARSADIDSRHEWRLNGKPVPSPRAIIDEMVALIGPPEVGHCGVMHGDFCLSNILFDFRRKAVKLIDPRGSVIDGVPSIYGDTRYDVAKLHHSVAGRFDFIVANYYSLSRDGDYAVSFEVSNGPTYAELESLFFETICASDEKAHLTSAAISILLFLSMLPLHNDNPCRQWAFLANAFRLYGKYFSAGH